MATTRSVPSGVILKYLLITRSLLRVPTYILMCTYLIVGYLAGMLATSTSHPGPYFIGDIVLGFLVIALWYINAAALNDYADYEIDLINLQGDADRPLVTGQAVKRDLLAVAIVTGVASLGIAVCLSLSHVLLVGMLLILNMLYSLPPTKLSYRGVIPPLILPVAYTILPFCLGYFALHVRFSPVAAIILIGMYFQFIGRIILKDYRDVKGDMTHGKRTFLIRYGSLATCIVAAFALVVSALTLLMTGSYVSVLHLSIVALTTFGLLVLRLLSKAGSWQEQKPLLSAFGRSMTGITASLIVGLSITVWHLETGLSIVATIMIVGVYLLSAKETYEYTASRLKT